MLRALPLAAAVLGAGCATLSSGYLYRGPCTHVTVRITPEALDLREGSASVRVKSDFPVCHEVYPNRGP